MYKEYQGGHLLTRKQAAINTELYRTKLSNKAPSKGTACLGNGCRAHYAKQLLLSKTVYIIGADKICNECTADTARRKVCAALGHILHLPLHLRVRKCTCIIAHLQVPWLTFEAMGVLTESTLV